MGDWTRIPLCDDHCHHHFRLQARGEHCAGVEKHILSSPSHNLQLIEGVHGKCTELNLWTWLSFSHPLRLTYLYLISNLNWLQEGQIGLAKGPDVAQWPLMPSSALIKWVSIKIALFCFQLTTKQAHKEVVWEAIRTIIKEAWIITSQLKKVWKNFHPSQYSSAPPFLATWRQEVFN